MAVEEAINARLQAIAGVIAQGSTGKTGGEMRWKRKEHVVDGKGRRSVAVGEEDRELVEKEGKAELRREGKKLWRKEGEARKRGLEKKILKGERGVERRRSKTTGRETLVAAARASPHSRSARRRSRWDDDGNNVLEKKISLDKDMKAAPDAFLPIISEIEDLIGKGRMETENTAAVPSLHKKNGTSSKCEESGTNHYTEFFKKGECEVNLKLSEAANVNSLPIFSQQERTAFVVGFKREVQDCDLKEYFGRFGEVESTRVKYDQATGLSKCFGFVVFKDMSARMDVTAQRNHVIKGKEMTCQRTGPGLRHIEIYVDNLPLKGLSDDDLADHFSQFGPVADVIRPLDEMNNTQQFCFIVFDKEETGLKLIEQGCSTINGQTVVIKSVSPGAGGLRREKECFNCGETAHIARDCPQRECSTRGEMVHLTRACKQEGWDKVATRGACYNCREIGHLARECPHHGGDELKGQSENVTQGGSKDGCGKGSHEDGEFGKMRKQGKIFVGNLTLEGATVDDVRHHFSQV